VESPLGIRKDVRNAVEAARKAEAWAKATAQIARRVLYYIAENLSQRGAEISQRLAAAFGARQPSKKVSASIERLFSYAAGTDKFDGAVHRPYRSDIAIAMNEPVGTVGLLCPSDSPLLGFFSLVLPVDCRGATPLLPCLPKNIRSLLGGICYQVFETSDLPGGVVNISPGGVRNC